MSILEYFFIGIMVIFVDCLVSYTLRREYSILSALMWMTLWPIAVAFVIFAVIAIDPKDRNPN